MRKILSAAAIGVFALSFVWQYGSWIAEWMGRLAGLSVTAGYNEFFERHIPIVTMRGGIVEIVAPWLLMDIGRVLFWSLRPEPKRVFSSHHWNCNRGAM